MQRIEREIHAVAARNTFLLRMNSPVLQERYPRIAPDALAPVVEYAMQQRFIRSHLTDQALLRLIERHASEHSSSGAQLLADIAAIDDRKLFLGAGYPSLLEYCVGHLKLSRDAAGRRIQAARTAQRFPWIFEAIEDRRLTLTSVNVLSAHLKDENAEELLAAAIHKDKEELQQLLAEGNNPPEAPSLDFYAADAASADDTTAEAHAPAHVILPLVSQHASPEESRAREMQPAPVPRHEPRMLLKLMVTRAVLEQLRHAQNLLAHEIPSRDAGKVFEKAIQVLIRRLEKRKFGATDRPRTTTPRRRAKGGRYVPASVRNAVWERDGGQCTFVSESGHRCEMRRLIEFDHELEVARGGKSTLENVRLRCRAHNQYAAERTFGAEFMKEKRERRTG